MLRSAQNFGAKAAGRNGSVASGWRQTRSYPLRNHVGVRNISDEETPSLNQRKRAYSDLFSQLMLL